MGVTELMSDLTAEEKARKRTLPVVLGVIGLFVCVYAALSILILFPEPYRPVDSLEYASFEYVLYCRGTYDGTVDLVLKQCEIGSDESCEVVEESGYFASCDDMELAIEDGVIIIPGYRYPILTHVP